jgi:hypothetical protein
LDYEPESEEELALQEKYDEMDEDFEDDDLEDDDTDDDLDLGEDEEDSDS